MEEKLERILHGRFLILSVILILVLMLPACNTEKETLFGLNEDGVFHGAPDKFPEPVGVIQDGWQEISNYIDKRMIIPDSARNIKLVAKVNIELIVNEDGSVSDIKVNSAKKADDKEWSKYLGYGCDEEALRLVKSLPVKWKPAVYKGKPVRFRQLITIDFGNNDIWNAKNPCDIMAEPLPTPEQYDYFRGLTEQKKEPSPRNFADYSKFSENIKKYVKSNTKYPVTAIKNNLSGTVYVSFILDENGRITESKIEKGINKDFDDEALRVIKNMEIGHTLPDYDNHGNFIKYKYTVPVSFKL